MKLLYITNGINGSGGLERVLSVKASYLADHYDYEVHILVLNHADKKPFYQFSDKISCYSIPVSGNPISYFLSYKNGIQKTINQFQPDVISVCDDGLKGFFLPRVIKTSAKWIYERHASIELNTDTSIKGRLIKWLMKNRVSSFDKFVVLTNKNKKEWQSENVIVIPNPLSFSSEKSSTLENNKVIAVGSHSYNKGYDLLIEAWQIIESKFPDWELNIYGKVDKNQTFIKMTENLNLKNIHFYEPVKDIKEKYLESSVLVLSSRSEGFGMVLTEAMECGLPCVAFDCPSGPADIIKDGEDGFLVEKENTDELAEKLITLIENQDLRKQMGAKAKGNVKRFSAETIVQEWDKLFKELSQ